MGRVRLGLECKKDAIEHVSEMIREKKLANVVLCFDTDQVEIVNEMPVCQLIRNVIEDVVRQSRGHSEQYDFIIFSLIL